VVAFEEKNNGKQRGRLNFLRCWRTRDETPLEYAARSTFLLDENPFENEDPFAESFSSTYTAAVLHFV